MMKYIILGLFIISLVSSQSCSITYYVSILATKVNSISLNPSTEETKIWGLKDVFFTGQGLTYTISDNSTFQIQAPVFPTDVAKGFNSYNPIIVQLIPQVLQSSQAWTNNFALLSQDSDNTYVYWATGKQQDTRTSPEFNTVNYINPKQNLKCLRLAYLDQDTVIVDCFDPIQFKNYYYVQNILQAPSEFEVQNMFGYTTVTDRISQVYSYPSIGGKSTKYLFRGVPSQAGDIKLRGQSVIEVFSFDDSNKPTFTGNFLDAATLSTITKDTSKTFSFNLVDFKITPYGIIYVLDSSMKLYRVQYQADGQWTSRGVIENKQARALAFDVNTNPDTGLTRVAILFLDYFILYDWPQYSNSYTSSKLYELDFTITGAVGAFSFSDTFIFIQDTDTDTLYTFDTVSNQVLTKVQLDISSFVLVNPYYDIAVTVDSAKTQTWSFTQGLLLLNAPKTKQDTQTVTITATADNKQFCTAQISFQVYDKADWNIYSLQSTSKPLPSFITYPSQTQFQLSGLATGPNLNYDVMTTKKDTFLAVEDTSPMNVYQYVSLSVTNETYPKATDVIFSETISTENNNVYTQVIQTSNLNVTVWQCTVNELIPNTSVCVVLGNITTSQRLQETKFYQMAFFDSVIVMIQDSEFQISAYVCDERVCKQASTIKYTQQTGNEITSFIMQNQHIWVLRQTSRTIDLYSAYGDFELIDSITQKSIDLGFDAFAPTQLFTNRLFSDLVFINNQNALLIVDYQKELKLFKILPYKLNKPSVHVAVGKDTFFLSQLGQDTSLLYQYSLADLTNIVLQNDVNLLWYTFQLPLQAKVSKSNGFLYIRALCTKCQKTFILSFSPNVQQRDSIFYAINLGVLIEDNKSIIFSVGGLSDMYVYVNDGTTHSNHKLLLNPFLVVTPQPSSNEIFSSSILNLKVLNYDFEGKNELVFTQNVTIYNTRTNITIDENKFNNQANGLFAVKNKDYEQTIKLSDNWYDGQVLRFDINCADCNKNIFIRNHVELEQLPFSYADATDFSTYNTKTLVQTPDTIYITLNNSLSQTIIRLDRPTSDFSCSLITPSEDGLYIVSICQDSTQVYAYITSCITESECFAVDYIVLTGVTKVSKVALIGYTLFVLNSDWQNPLDFEGSLQVFTLLLDQVEWKAFKIYDFNSQFLNSTEDPTLYATDFDFQPIKTNDPNTKGYQFYLMTALKGIYSMQVIFTGQQLTQLKNLIRIDLPSFLQGQSQFISEETIFLSLKAYKSTQNDALTEQTDSIFFTTNNLAHYGLSFSYSSKPVKTSIDFVVNRYGSLPTLNKVKVSSTTIAIPYGDQSTNTVVVAVYEIPKKTTQYGSVPPVVLMKGGNSLQLSGDQYNNLAMQYQTANESQILINGESSIIYSPDLKLSIFNGSKVPDQELEIIANNGFSSVSVKTQITHTGDSKDGSSEWKWWYTFLIVIGALLIFGGVGYFVLQKRKDTQARESGETTLLGTQVDPLLGQVQQGNYQSQTSAP